MLGCRWAARLRALTQTCRRVSPLSHCAIPECQVPPFRDRSLDHETPVLIVGYRQDTAILDSHNVLDPPRRRPLLRAVLRDVDEAMLQHRRIGSACRSVDVRGLARGCVYYREERVCGQHGSVTVLEHDRVPLRDRPSSMGHTQAEPTGSEPSLNVRFRAGKGADSCEQATALRFARTERARAWLHGARSCRLRICGAARVMFAPT